MTRHLPFAITLDPGTSRANHTGTWRSERPVYVHGTAPCSHACPAGEPVQAWLYDAEDGGYERAWRRLVEVSPFPAVLGRVCYHPCETACNRAELDHAVGINSVERFLGDEAIAQGWALPEPGTPTGHHVLVVGAGPAGLAAAYHLRRLGHAVTVRDAGHEPGGMMRSGIPTFRLPRDVLDAEIARIVALGVTLELDARVDDVPAAQAEVGADATLLAIGAQLSHRAYVPAGQSARVLDALDLLGAAAGGERPFLGRRVAVYGGGNTAMDAARTARRLGADEALVVYRRTRERMPADRVEVEEAAAEGVRFRWLSTVAGLDGDRLHVERVELDEHGVPQPTGEYDELGADALVLALGQDVDLTLLDSLPGVERDGGLVRADADAMTTAEGVFACGDAVPSQRSVSSAVGQGHRAALAIDAWLARRPAPAHPAGEPVPFERLNTWYYSDAPHAVRPRLDAGRRTADFSEVVSGLDADTALYEARRCLSCGNCFGCDNCYGMCPDDAIRKVVPDDGSPVVYEIDYDYCKGCGLCVTECPAGAIEMVTEQT